jgi:hypothetical protein
MRPPITAEIKPAEGGAPDAIEIPTDNGRAIKKTTRPDLISDRQDALLKVVFDKFICPFLFLFEDVNYLTAKK